MNLKSIIHRVQQTADTDGLKINAATVSRVIKLTFDALAELDPKTAVITLLRELERREKHRS